MKQVHLMQILDARERRAAKQKELLRRYGKTLVCFTMNIPGPVKVSPEIEAAFKIGNSLLRQHLSVLHTQDCSAVTGYERFYVVEGDPVSVKKACLSLEDILACGRLFDMDVLTPEGEKISREQLQLPRRKCLICRQDAAICGRSRAHSVPQLQAATNRHLTGIVPELLWRTACEALTAEAETTPKPGLVDLRNNGSHRDMDIDLFRRSSNALGSYFLRCARAGSEDSDPGSLFCLLRGYGLQAEQEMHAATGGINTHKGAIFSMGIAVAAAARCYPDTRPEAILSCCRKMTAGLVKRDLGGITVAKTAGEQLYIQHGITGPRGQAEEGFPAVLSVGLPVLQEGLRQGLSLNDAGCAALLHLLRVTDDTNLIHRSDLQTLRNIQSKLDALLEQTPYPDRMVIEELDLEFIKRNLSPGGSADLLALTYFLHFLNT